MAYSVFPSIVLVTDNLVSSRTYTFDHDHDSLHIKIEENWLMGKVTVRRGVKQEHTLSPKLFTLALEDVFMGLLKDRMALTAMVPT